MVSYFSTRPGVICEEGVLTLPGLAYQAPCTWQSVAFVGTSHFALSVQLLFLSNAPQNLEIASQCPLPVGMASLQTQILAAIKSLRTFIRLDTHASFVDLSRKGQSQSPKC